MARTAGKNKKSKRNGKDNAKKGRSGDLRPTRARRVIYKFPSIKNDLQMIVEEWLELRYCLWLEYDQSVRTYQCQPNQFEAFFDGKIRRYGPDFRVFFWDIDRRQLFVEAKPTRWMGTRRVRDIQTHFRPLIKEIGEFRFWTEEDASTPLLDNLHKLYPYARFPLRPDLEIDVLARLSRETASCTIAAFVESFSSPHLILPVVYALIFTQKIFCDLTIPLRMGTLISHPNRKETRVG